MADITLHPLPTQLLLPRPPAATNGINLSKELRKYLDDSINRWDRELVRALEQRLGALTGLVNEIIAGTIFDAWIFQDEMIGARDSTNKVYTFPHPPRIGVNGIPQALVLWKGGPQRFTTASSPQAIEWVLNPDGTILLGQPPDAGDSLVAYVIAASTT